MQSEKVKEYEIRISTSPKFKNAKKIKCTGKSFKIKGLSKKKTYYIQVRAYKNDSTGSKVYGKWSESYKIKKISSKKKS